MHKIHKEFINPIEHTLHHQIHHLAINQRTRTTSNIRDKLFQLITVKMHQNILS